VREARQNLSAQLEHVAEGHEVLITSCGEPGSATGATAAEDG
jgi:prevent-host-death family protein